MHEVPLRHVHLTCTLSALYFSDYFTITKNCNDFGGRGFHVIGGGKQCDTESCEGDMCNEGLQDFVREKLKKIPDLEPASVQNKDATNKGGRISEDKVAVFLVGGQMVAAIILV